MHANAASSSPRNLMALSDEQFRQLASSLSSVVWSMSTSGARFVSPRWSEITGRTESQLQDDGWIATIHEDDRSLVRRELRQSLAHGCHFQADFRLALRDGSHHWFRARAEPTRGRHGDIVGWIGLASNIDDQKEAEQALLENERWLRMVIKASRVGTIDHDVTTGAIVVSPTILHLFGLAEGTVLSFDMVADRIHPDDRAAFDAAVARAVQPSSNGAVDLVSRVVRPQGQIVWANTRGTYLFEGDGADRRAVRFIGVASDITEHMRDLSERAMAGAIITSSRDAIIAVTPDAIVTHWNGAAERIFGYTAAEMIGQPVIRLVPDDERASCLEKIAAVLSGGQVVGYAATRLSKTGVPIAVSVTLSIIRDESGRATGVSSILRDVRQQKELEAQVVQAQKMEAVGLLAGGVAHDLNNTLTAILVGLELTELELPTTETTRSRLQEMRRACLDSAQLIRQLLAVARRQVINPQACSVNRAVAGLSPMLRRLIGADIAYTTELDATRGAYVDPAQLNQVLLNLSVNARDAMPHGGWLTIRSMDDPTGDRVLITVEDSGCGMSPETLARIYEPFFTTKEPGRGTGLGLSTTYGIVAQCGGTIEVTSTVDVGTRFTIALPAIEEPTYPLTTSSERVMVEGNETILVVEDDKVVREVVARVLEQRGYRVVEALCGTDALIAIEHLSSPVDLVLSDVVMPGMSGVELLSAVRARYPKMRAVFMSGYSEQAIATYGEIVPGTALLQKPFQPSALAAAVRRALDESVGEAA